MSSAPPRPAVLAAHTATALPLRRLVAGGLAAVLTLMGLGTLTPQAAQAALLPTLPVVVDGRVDAFEVVGDRAFVAGTFTEIRLPNGTVVSQPYLFAYSLTTGLFDAAFRPLVAGGSVVDVEAVPGGGGVYIGGSFNEVNGVTKRRIARLALDGSLDTTFKALPNSKVNNITTAGSRVFIGGQFSQVAGTDRKLVAEVNATTGALVTGFDMPLTGSAASGGFVQVQSLEVSPDGTKLLIAHNATHVAGRERLGLAVVDLSSRTGVADALSPWFTTHWKDVLPLIGGAVRLSKAAWGPSSDWVAVANAGGDVPGTNDTLVRFDVTGAGPQAPTWVTRQFDSGFSVTVGPDGTVYGGGHFRYTEAPGSTEPWPGDTDTNYGWGQDTGGARVLGGDEVVGRMQLVALDPTTGKALNWYAVADGHLGVTALMLAGDRLLVGHDGSRVGTQLSGRHGAVPAYGAPRDASRPLTTTTAPLMGAILTAGAVTFSGTATAPAGVRRVFVEVKSGTRWLRPDGTLGAFYQWTATLAAPGATSTAWSLSLGAPLVGEYVASPKTQDGAKVNESERIEVPFEIVDEAANEPPEITITAPLGGQADFTDRTITVGGTAVDPDGVTGVQLAFYNRTRSGYLQQDGSIGPSFVAFPATLAAEAGFTTAWTAVVSPPNGEYRMTVKATDGEGATTPAGVSVVFTVSPDNPAPASVVTNLVAGQAIGSTVTVTGTATDDTGVDRVFVRLIDSRFSQGSAVGGGFGEARWVQAALAAPGATSTTWSITFGDLALGRYNLSSYAVDDQGLQTPTAQRVAVIGLQRRPAAALTSEPRTAILAADAATFRATDLTVPLSGTASYGSGVSVVALVVQHSASGRWLQADGTLGVQLAQLSVPVTPAGATSVTWSTTLTLPTSGAYRVDALAIGTDGNPDWSSAGARGTYLVYPGDADPTLDTWAAPADGITVTGGVISANGRAVDDTGVASVELQLRNSATTGLRADGSIGVPEWVSAFTTNPGGTGSNWTYVSPALPPGTWTVSVRVTDVVGKVMLTPPTRTVTVR